MSKRNAIIIITAVLLIIIAVLFFSFRPANTGTKNQVTSNVSPFGVAPAQSTSTNTNTGSNANTQVGQTNSANQNLAKLMQLYASPTSGSVFFATTSGGDVLQFVDRGTGNVYQYIPASQSGQPTRVTDTTIPKVEETVWSSTGNDLVYRYLDNDTDTIDSFSGTITAATDTADDLAQIDGNFLNQNITELVANPSGDKIFGLLEKTDGSGSYGFTSNFDGTDLKEIFDSPASFWNISWPTDTIVTFTTKPTYEDYGFLYFFNTQTDSFQRILGDMTGLSTLTNSDASFVAYSQSENNAFALGIYKVKNNTEENISVATLADKCVWSIANPDTLYCAVPQSIPPDNYPDAWYQGTESFSDNIWMINADTDVATELYQMNPSENQNIDAIDLTISPDDKYLAFENKDDLSLWLLSLDQN